MSPARSPGAFSFPMQVDTDHGKRGAAAEVAQESVIEMDQIPMPLRA